MPIGIRWLFILFLAVVFIFSIERADTRELDADERPDQQRFYPYFPNYLLPVFFGMLAVIVLFDRSGRMGKMTLALCFTVFAHTCVYYLLLSVCMPLLRRRISSRVCAALWLTPNYLYLIVNSLIVPEHPTWTVYIPQTALLVLCVVWLVGFVVVLTRKIWSHYQFRRAILKDARNETAPGVLEIWGREQMWAGYHPEQFDLVRSPAVSTPLTIGCWMGTIRVVLPERDYTPEELKLIFCHELVHIGRDDSKTKFFLTFCTAMCWFNPLMWLAMRRSADDLELSCDETVLLKAEDSTRRQYADLLLRTAGDERGFTTCLSASAQALRYRLRYVMQPKKRSVGSVTAGVVFFALLMTCGHVTLAFDKMTGAELIFGGEDPAQFQIEDNEVAWHEATGYDITGWHWPRVDQPAALKEYLAGLEVYEVADFYDLYDYGWEMTITFLRGEQRVRVSLTDHVLHVSGSHHDAARYFVPEEIDWAYLESLLYGR